jgi:hypothetical protein
VSSEAKGQELDSRIDKDNRASSEAEARELDSGTDLNSQFPLGVST